MERVFRTLHSDEVQAAAAVAKQCFPGNEIVLDYIMDEFTDMFSNARWKPKHFVAEVDKKIVGFAGWNYSWAAYDTAEISLVGILPEYRNQGLGSELLKHLFMDIRIKMKCAEHVLVSTNRITMFTRLWFRTVCRIRSRLNGESELMVGSISLGCGL